LIARCIPVLRWSACIQVDYSPCWAAMCWWRLVVLQRGIRNHRKTFQHPFSCTCSLCIQLLAMLRLGSLVPFRMMNKIVSAGQLYCQCSQASVTSCGQQVVTWSVSRQHHESRELSAGEMTPSKSFRLHRQETILVKQLPASAKTYL
jgi:hypothetical protein